MAIKSKSLHQMRKPKSAILRRAATIAKHYRIILKGVPGGYEGRGVEIAEAHGCGRTSTECVRNIRDAMVRIVAECLRKKQIPPISLSQAERTKRVRVYVTSYERLVLECKAVQSGMASVEEYIRSIALSK
jgi:hypothetical protein